MPQFKRLALGLAAIAAMAGLTGCYTLNVRAQDFYGDPAPQATPIKAFSVELKSHHLILGLITLNSPEVKAAIDREVKAAGGTAARNVKLKHQHEVIDGLLGIITGNLYRPSTTTLTGEVVK